MPQWAGSCWYYLRYLDPDNAQAAWSPEVEKQWLPVDLYVGGAEHAVLHLLYARFWHKVLFDLGYVSTPEPFKKLRHQGTVLAFSYQDSLGHYHEPTTVELRGDEAFLKATGEKLKVSVEKMAKSKLNGINPDDVVAQYGADVLRLYEMFMGEFELPKPWDPRAIEGCARFLKRVWRLVEEWTADKAPTDDPHLRLRHKTIKKVTGDLERMAFNTAIAAMMEFVNELTAKGATREDLLALVKLVGPFAPHLGDEAWEKLGEKGLLGRRDLADLRSSLDHRRRGHAGHPGQRQDARQSRGRARRRRGRHPQAGSGRAQRGQAPRRQDRAQGHRGSRPYREHRHRLAAGFYRTPVGIPTDAWRTGFRHSAANGRLMSLRELRVDGRGSRENCESLPRTCATRLVRQLVGTFIAYRRRRRYWAVLADGHGTKRQTCSLPY